MSEDLITADDGLDANVVGPWAEDKHQRVRKYVGISSAARKKFSVGRTHPYSTCFIDLYCACGRAMIRDTGEFIDGSSVAAWSESVKKNSPFSHVIIGDANADRLGACKARLEALGAQVTSLHGPAEETAKIAATLLDPNGLHVALLDPYNLDALPFSVISDLAALQKMDMIVRFDSGDLERNLGNNLLGQQDTLDSFCPGWREAVKPGRNQSQKHDVFERWLQLVKGLTLKPSHGVEEIKNNNNRTIYWLVFLSRHKLADKFWEEIRHVGQQSTLF